MKLNSCQQHTMMRAAGRAILPVLAILLSGCGDGAGEPDASSPGGLPSSATGAGLVDPFLIDLDALVDLRNTSPEAWIALLERATTPEKRQALVHGLGRMRGSGLAPALRELPPSDSLRHDVTARQDHELLKAWSFALGQDGGADAARLLQPLLEEGDAAVRRAAAEALGRLPEGGGDLAALAAALADPDPGVRGAVLLSLVRYRGRRVADAAPLPDAVAAAALAGATAALKDDSERLRWQAAYALANLDLPGRGFPLLGALASPDPLVRMFAARGLGRLESVDGLPAHAVLRQLASEDPDPHVAASAAAALAELQDGAAIPYLLTALRQHEQPADHHRRQAAAAALAALIKAEPDQAAVVRPPLVAALSDASPRVRRQAALALTALDPAALVDAVVASVSQSDPRARQTAAAAMAGSLDPRVPGLLEDLSNDPVPAVTAAALSALAGRQQDMATARRIHLASLSRDDVAVRGTALAGLAICGQASDLEAVAAALADAAGPDGVELRAEALNTAAALGGTHAQDLLRASLADPSPAVRQRAVDLLPAAGEDATSAADLPPARPSSVALPPVPGAGSPPPRVRLHTRLGIITVELRPMAAPRHTAAFLALSREGAYDGLTFHRIVSGFVAQGLDPRGDGWGTCGAFLRDEIHPEPYLRGSVGMPNAGPDTGGCQIFITHVPTPHLDGAYTIFGQVVAGMDVVDALDWGDVVDRVEVPPGPR